MTLETQLLMVVRLVVAALLGALIGSERESRGRDAGIRTFGAVALGACAFTILSYVVVPPGNDTTRIAAQVVTGAGFLGAGVILRARGHISGLTTSATLWAMAAVGMAIGYGLYVLGIATAALLLGLLLLRRLPPFDHHTHETHDDLPVE